MRLGGEVFDAQVNLLKFPEFLPQGTQSTQRKNAACAACYTMVRRSVSVALPTIGVSSSLRALRVISASSAFLPPPLNPVNPVENQPVPPPPLAHRVSDTMAVRQNTVRKSAFLPPVRHLAAPLSRLLVASASGSVGVLEGGRP